MKFGCCLPGGPYDAERAERLLGMGFDYAELAAAPLAGLTDGEFAALKREVQAGGLPAQPSSTAWRKASSRSGMTGISLP